MPFRFKLEESMIIGDRQTQRAGDNSQLMQAGIVNVYNGIDEKRAREICAETYAIARKDFTADAYACATERVQQFEEALLPKLQQIEGALNKFADPSFQFLLTSAQRTAAATERSSDYDMLSELLVCRITKGEYRKNRAGISRAVEIVDKVDDDALCALTVVHAVNKVLPSSGDINVGLQVLDNMFGKLMYTSLPNGEDWIEHLDILDAVRISSSSRFKKLDEYYSERLNGYSAAGICVASEEYHKAMELLASVNISPEILVPTELLDGYVRIPVVNRDAINDMSLRRCVNISGQCVEISAPATEAEKAVLFAVWDLYASEDAKEQAKSKFMVRWDSFSSLRILHQWWDALSPAFTITHVGTVLAHTNARRCDNTIPELPLAT